MKPLRYEIKKRKAPFPRISGIGTLTWKLYFCGIVLLTTTGMAPGLFLFDSFSAVQEPGRLSGDRQISPYDVQADVLDNSKPSSDQLTVFPQELRPQLMGNKSVNPISADVGDQLEFSISISNVGTAPAQLIEITDVFTDTLTVNNVTTTKGNAYFDNKKVLVKMNSLNMKQKENISIFVTVNATLNTVTTLYNTAHFTYHYEDQSFRGSTNSVIFQIGATAYPFLPFTGGVEKSSSLPSKQMNLIISGIVLSLLGTSALVLSFWLKKRYPGLRNPIQFISLGIFMVGISISMIACTQSDTRVYQQEEPTSPATTAIKSLETALSPLIDTLEPSPVPAFTQSTMPDYPIPTPSMMVGEDNRGIAFDISPIQRIVIPSLDLDTVVKYVPFDGRTWKIDGLTTEVVWMGETSWPGLGGNTGLSAHVSLPDGSDGPFRYLSELDAGDIIELYTEMNRYIYEVRLQQVVQDSDLSVINPTDHSQITLITCTDWSMALEKYLSRLVVYSDLLDIQPAESNTSFH